jgi:hypothetical protein
MLADWIVIPLSLSAGRKSVVVLPVSTDPGEEIYEDESKMDSVNVVFPESVYHTALSSVNIDSEGQTYVSHESHIANVCRIMVGGGC